MATKEDNDTPERARRSFRDPSGVLIRRGQEILRVVNGDAVVELETFLATSLASTLVTEGALVGTRATTNQVIPTGTDVVQSGTRVYAHDPVFFPSYPYEWAPEMLHAAGGLTLELALRSLDQGFGLKDATPYNILFDGPSPVFVDVLSFERRNPRDAIWRPYAQFVTTFLLPLLAAREWGMSLRRIFHGSMNGIAPSDAYNMAGPLQRLRSPFLGLVSMPVWLSGAAQKKGTDLYNSRQESSPDKARYILRSSLRSLRRTLAKVKPRSGRVSVWSGYMEDLPYSEQGFDVKQELVKRYLEANGARSVLDIGCNTGTFSAIAARLGARVVGIDTDEATIGRVWAFAREQELDILPLVADFANPSPAFGWRNDEQLSFLDRARGKFDTILALGILHHLLVTERIPLESVVELLAEITTGVLILEYIPANDQNFIAISRGREALHSAFTIDAFEKACLKHFTIQRSDALSGSERRLYVLLKK